MTPHRKAQPEKSVSWLLIFSFCWTLICWLNTSLSENPIIFMILTGLLVIFALANIIVFVSPNRA